MSEIFEALRKAQRETGGQRASDGDSGRASDEGPAAHASPTAPPDPVARPERRRRARHSGRRGWIRRLLAGTQNGRVDAAPSLLCLPEDGTVIGEQFRILRTRMENTGPGAFMIVSALAQEGKTLCVANLGVALSFRTSGGVILVDADLRHPSLHAYFDLSHHHGLVDCLLGERSWRDCIQPTRFERLRVLPSGRHSSLAPELLDSAQMQQLTRELRAEFPDHHIVFDAPPVLLTADPLVIARHMDHLLLVVRAGVTPREAALKAIEALGADRFLGVILNDAHHDISYSYYYGSYPYERPEPRP